MTKLRTGLTIGVVVVAGIGAAAGFTVVYQASPEAARSLLAVDAGVLVSLAVTVWVLLGPLSKRIDDLVEALRALARGEKHTRVEPADFAGLAEIARATNEVAAYLCENDDPNLGPVLKRSRDHAVEVPQPRRSSAETRPPPQPSDVATRASRGAVQEISEHPEIGAVRVRPRDAARAGVDAPSPIIDGESVSEARPARRRATTPGANEAAATPPPAAAASTTHAPEAPAPSPADATDHAPAALAAATSADGQSAIPVSLASEPPTTSEPGTSPSTTSEATGEATGESKAEATGESKAEATGESKAEATSAPTAESTAESTSAAGDSKSPPSPSSPAVAERAAPEAPGAVAASTASSSQHATNDTVIEPARPATVSIPPAPPTQLPTRDELHSLFTEFVRAKKAAGVDDGLDVDFDAFADTIRGESERLINDHACRAVRFEVAIAEGEVSLRPRLVR